MADAFDIEAEDPQPVAARLKPLLPEGTTVFSSPLQRARLLAEALDPETRIDERLSEIDFGESKGSRGTPLIAMRSMPGPVNVPIHRHPAVNRSPDCNIAPSISSPRFVVHPIALVTHCGVIRPRALLGHWRQLPLTSEQLQIDFIVLEMKIIS